MDQEDMTRSSRLAGWYRRTPAERRRLIASWSEEDPEALAELLDGGGLTVAVASELVESVVGLYALPFAVAANFEINGRDVLVPMVIEEPSVVAAASNAARMVRAGGGFLAETEPPVMTAQIQIHTADVPAAARRVAAERDRLLGEAARHVPSEVRDLGGGPVGLEVRALDAGDGTVEGAGLLVVHVHVDVRDAMGANIVNTVGEALAPELGALTGGRVGLRILTNLAERRTVTVSAHVPPRALALPGFAGERVAAGVADASRFAEVDPYRAATHNKGIFNGVDAVVLATGNDWRAVEAGGHAFAARDGRYGPLATWRLGDDGALEGRLTMPMALGSVGGMTGKHPLARFAVRLTGAAGALELAEIAGAAGLATNLAALRALATEGIQRGHMRLHGRSSHLAGGPAGSGGRPRGPRW